MIAFVLRALLDVRFASHLGALVAGEPQMGPRLVAIAARESRLEPIGVHGRDAWASKHVRPPECTGAGYSTRGAHGLMAGYSMRWLPSWAACMPWLLDVPVLSAYVAAKRAKSNRCSQVRRCRSWRSA